MNWLAFFILGFSVLVELGLCRVEKESGTMPINLLNRNTRFRFRQPFSAPPLVYAWVRGHRTERYRMDVHKVSNANFVASFTRTSMANAHRNPVKFYWTARERAPDKRTVVGNAEQGGAVPIGRPAALFAPTLTETSTNVYEVFGRDVYASQLYRLLRENTEFPVKQTTEASMSIEVTVRCDTLHVDDNVNPFYGIKKMTVRARKIISNGSPLVFSASQRVLAEFGDTKLPTASVGLSGQSNDEAIPGSKVDVFAYEVQGNVRIILRGSNSTMPQDGGDGRKGRKGVDTPKREDCKSACKLTTHNFIHGYRGGRGIVGGHGLRGGDSIQPGGDAGDIVLYVQRISGIVTVTQSPGKAGRPAAHGYGGPGGPGGSGGCGCMCRKLSPWEFVMGYPGMWQDILCPRPGSNGTQGPDGPDGFAVYGIPSIGQQGSAGSTDLRRVDSVRQWFAGDDELLRLIEREAEVLFQRNNNKDAKPMFDFIVNVANETSLVYQQADEILKYIEQGFDFYGNSVTYAPDKDWTYLEKRSRELLQVGQSLENTYNVVFRSAERSLDAARTISSTVDAVIRTDMRTLEFKEVQLRSKSDLYLEALKHIELAMEQEMNHIQNLTPVVLIEAENNQKLDVFDFITSVVGIFLGIGLKNPLAVYDKSVAFISNLIERNCELPTILQLQSSLRTNVQFAVASQGIADDFNYSSLNASAVPQIMKSNLAKNRGKIIQELHCVFEETSSENALTLDRLLNDFFRDGAFRIEIIEKLMNMGSQLKQLEHNRRVLEETQFFTNQSLAAAVSGLQMEAKYYLADMLLNLYQQQENVAMHSIYELSKAYQFESLWNFNVLNTFESGFSDKNVVLNAGSLNGMFQLNLLHQRLQRERDNFLDYAAAFAGSNSHIFDAYWEFSETTHPAIISKLRATGQTTITLDIDPSDPLTTRCGNCFSGRLIGLYVEIVGATQANSVPSKTYVMVSHQGDSRFLVPLSDGNVTATIFQQTPEGADSGRLMSFDSSQLLSNDDVDGDDSALQAKFSDPEHQYCDGDANNFSGIKPCRSPYATYVITVPKSDDYVCPSDRSDTISGFNCQDFDFSKLNEIRIYAKISSWSNYPPDPRTARDLFQYRNKK